MTPPRFLLDEHVPQAIQSQLLRLDADIDILAVGQPLSPPKGTLDPDILRWIEKCAVAGLYEVTPDDNPVIGAHIGGVEGFYCAVGFSGHGFQQSPAVGRILAELITSGQTSFDISPFRLERFEEGEVVGEERVV